MNYLHGSPSRSVVVKVFLVFVVWVWHLECFVVNGFGISSKTTVPSSKIPYGSSSTTPATSHEQEERPPPPTTTTRNHQHQHASVWKTIEQLSTSPTTKTHPLTPQVISILTNWGVAYKEDARFLGILNKSNLLQEIEESTVALYHLITWLDDQDREENPVMLVDAACGKGICSLLASYLFQNDRRVSSILMMDSNQDLDWSHIQVANEFAHAEVRPRISAIRGNFYDMDDVMDLLSNTTENNNKANLPPLAMIGIHLCKNLSPTFVGLANALGPTKVPFLCLAPCCLPRVVLNARQGQQFLEVAKYESPLQRQGRLTSMKRRQQAQQRTTTLCTLCQSTHHRVQQCPLLPNHTADHGACRGIGTMLEMRQARPPQKGLSILHHIQSSSCGDQTRNAIGRIYNLGKGHRQRLLPKGSICCLLPSSQYHHSGSCIGPIVFYRSVESSWVHAGCCCGGKQHQLEWQAQNDVYCRTQHDTITMTDHPFLEERFRRKMRQPSNTQRLYFEALTAVLLSCCRVRASWGWQHSEDAKTRLLRRASVHLQSSLGCRRPSLFQHRHMPGQIPLRMVSPQKHVTAMVDG